VALKSFEIFKRDNYLDRIAKIEKYLIERFEKIESDLIESKRVFGVTGVIEVKDSKDLKGFQKFAYDRGVWLRPFGNYMYTMPPYIVEEDEMGKIVDVMKEWFEEKKN